MKRIKFLLLLLLILVLSGCSLIPLEYGMKIEDFPEEQLPKIVLGVKGKELLLDLDHVEVDIYYSFNGYLGEKANDDIEFIGCLLFDCKLEDNYLEFSKEQTDWKTIAGKIKGIQVDKETCNYDKNQIIKQEDGRLQYGYYRPMFIDQDHIVGKKGYVVIQMREVLYNKVENYYFSGIYTEIVLEYKIINGKVKLFFSGWGGGEIRR